MSARRLAALAGKGQATDEKLTTPIAYYSNVTWIANSIHIFRDGIRGRFWHDWRRTKLDPG
jgi:hypothetical protein